MQTDHEFEHTISNPEQHPTPPPPPARKNKDWAIMAIFALLLYVVMCASVYYELYVRVQ